MLGERLIAAAAVVRAQLAGGKAYPVRLEELMGSSIDALKLVSCMTLFRHVANALQAVEPRPQFATMAEHASTILTAAAAQGYRPCAFTEEHFSSSILPDGLPVFLSSALPAVARAGAQCVRSIDGIHLAADGLGRVNRVRS